MKYELTAIVISILTTNLIRMLPVVCIKSQIRNRFVRSFLYYVPYVTLAVMTFPAIVQSAPIPSAGVVAFVVGTLAAWRGAGLLPVAALCCAIVYLLN